MLAAGSRLAITIALLPEGRQLSRSLRDNFCVLSKLRADTRRLVWRAGLIGCSARAIPRSRRELAGDRRVSDIRLRPGRLHHLGHALQPRADQRARRPPFRIGHGDGRRTDPPLEPDRRSHRCRPAPRRRRARPDRRVPAADIKAQRPQVSCSRQPRPDLTGNAVPPRDRAIRPTLRAGRLDHPARDHRRHPSRHPHHRLPLLGSASPPAPSANGSRSASSTTDPVSRQTVAKTSSSPSTASATPTTPPGSGSGSPCPKGSSSR